MQLRRLIMSNYVKVLGFQIKLELESNSEKEYIIKNKEYERQLEESWKVVKEKNPNIVIYPEMTYIDDNEKMLRKLSKEKLIIAGSIYRGKRNTAIIFQDGEKIELQKKYASGAEPMIRYQEKITPREFFKQNLSSHTFEIEGKKVVVLNCMEYYHLAYYIAREYPDIFALISPCSNNNPKVFQMESNALHNHNENIYSFVVNGISNYNHQKYGKGQSYIYGPIQYHEKEWLSQENLLSTSHPSSILTLDDSPSYFYGEFTNNLVPYGRSDNYENNPKNILVKKIGGKKYE